MMGSPSEADWNALFDSIQQDRSRVERTHTEKRQLANLPGLSAFLDHCCQTRHYFFAIHKCGESDCTMCRPPRLPTEVFEQLHHFPDPVPDKDSDSYQSFDMIYGNKTLEKFRPSLMSKKPSAPFRLSGETVQNIVICSECLKPRCVYAQRMLGLNAPTQRSANWQIFQVCLPF